MTPKEFLQSKGITNLSEIFSASTIELYLEEYSDLILSIASKKAKVVAYYRDRRKGARWKKWNDAEDIYIMETEQMHKVEKSSILNCLKE